MSKFIMSPARREAILEAEGKVQEQLRRDFKPEPIAFEDKAFFVVSRCVAGPQGWKGLFQVAQLVTQDDKGRPLKKPTRTVIASGVDMVVAMAAMETRR